LLHLFSKPCYLFRLTRVVPLHCQMNQHYRNKLKVLIVEDSKIIINRIKSMLHDNKNITVVGEAIDYNGTMRMIEKKAPHAVLLDFRLQGVGGMEILKAIKQKYTGIKVIMLTVHYELYYKKLCKKAGADYFFDKATEFEKIPEVLISMLPEK
jgi:DNA-binding NarL/FixJ family response regulator